MSGWRAVLAVAVAAIVATIGLRVSEPDRDFETLTGVREQPVEINNGGVVTIGDLDAGAAVVVFGDTMPTQGVFLAVEATLAATGDEAVRLDRGVLASGERSYQTFDFASLSPEAGFAQTAWLVFELDPTDLAGAVLQLSTVEIVHGYQQRVQIDLAIDPAEADALRARAGDRVLDLPREYERGIG